MMSPSRKALLSHIVVYVVVSAILFAINASQTVAEGGTRTWWAFWPLANRLNQKLAEGACLLFAVVPIPDLEQMVCRVLIEHSVGQVQVHDFLFE